MSFGLGLNLGLGLRTGGGGTASDNLKARLNGQADLEGTLQGIPRNLAGSLTGSANSVGDLSVIKELTGSLTGSADLIVDPAPNWTPAELTSLALWLDADDASTITLNGSTVSQWDDKSGSGNHVTQANLALCPIYQSSVLNSLPVVRFDGSDDQLATSAAILTQQVFGIYSVTANRNPSGESAVMGQYASPSDPGRTLVYQNGVSTRLASIFSGYGSTTYNGTANSSFHIFGYEAIGLTYSLFYEAVNQASGSITGTSVANTSFAIGQPRTGGGTSFAAFLDAAEIVVALAPLSTTDRQKLEGYLAWKWGLEANLPSGHPYKSAPPTV